MMNPKIILSAILVAGLLAGCESGHHAFKAKLEPQAKISRANAEKTALAQVPNGTIKEGEIEKENGKLTWSFDIAQPGSADITEVAMDAIQWQRFPESPRDYRRSRSLRGSFHGRTSGRGSQRLGWPAQWPIATMKFHRKERKETK